MNDVTEFESSLAGTIDFFQNLRRKMGVLEAETGTQHDLLRTVATSVATLQQDQETDQRSLATLASDLAAQTAQLAKLQSDSRLLDEQMTQVETLVACLQQDGQDLRQTLATLIGDLRTQGAALRQELESALEQRTTPVARLLALEEQLADQSQQLHGLLAFLKAQGQDAGQTRQELQQQQERQKHLETLLGKLSADTNSTRQILNVLQTDLTTQSDTLRELDQTWRDGLATYQYRLSHLETAIADSGLPPAATRPEPLSLAALSVETAASPPALLPIEWERLDELAATVASAREEQQEQRGDLAAVQTTLATQCEYLSNRGDILAEQLQTQQQRLGELETTLDTLRQASPPATETDLLPLHEALATQAEILDELQRSIRQQLHTQQQRLGELEAVLGNPSQAPTHAIAANFQPPHDALADQAGTLDLLRQITQQQIATLTGTLENQRLEFQEVTDRIGDLQQDIQQIQQQQIVPGPVVEQHPRLEADDRHAQALRQNLDALQEAVTTLETRLTSQAQAFSGNFEQFQGLSTDIQDLQQQIAKLESFPRLSVLEQELTAQEQEIALLKDAVQQVKINSPHISEEVRQDSHDSQIVALETRLHEQQEHLTGLSATVEAIRTDTRVTQEKVLTMAANVAQRIHEFQNQLLAAKTAQGEQLQEVEQKLIWLQAAVETLESQRKPRRWFSMPATFTTIVFTVGVAFLAVLAQIIWTIG